MAREFAVRHAVPGSELRIGGNSANDVEPVDDAGVELHLGRVGGPPAVVGEHALAAVCANLAAVPREGGRLRELVALAVGLCEPAAERPARAAVVGGRVVVGLAYGHGGPLAGRRRGGVGIGVARNQHLLAQRAVGPADHELVFHGLRGPLGREGGVAAQAPVVALGGSRSIPHEAAYLAVAGAKRHFCVVGVEPSVERIARALDHGEAGRAGNGLVAAVGERQAGVSGPHNVLAALVSGRERVGDGVGRVLGVVGGASGRELAGGEVYLFAPGVRALVAAAAIALAAVCVAILGEPALERVALELGHGQALAHVGRVDALKCAVVERLVGDAGPAAAEALGLRDAAFACVEADGGLKRGPLGVQGHALGGLVGQLCVGELVLEAAVGEPSLERVAGLVGVGQGVLAHVGGAVAVLAVDGLAGGHVKLGERLVAAGHERDQVRMRVAPLGVHVGGACGELLGHLRLACADVGAGLGVVVVGGVPAQELVLDACGHVGLGPLAPVLAGLVGPVAQQVVGLAVPGEVVAGVAQAFKRQRVAHEVDSARSAAPTCRSRCRCTCVAILRRWRCRCSTRTSA